MALALDAHELGAECGRRQVRGDVGAARSPELDVDGSAAGVAHPRDAVGAVLLLVELVAAVRGHVLHQPFEILVRGARRRPGWGLLCLP